MKNGTHFNNAVKKMSKTKNIRSPTLAKKIRYIFNINCGENNGYHTLTQIPVISQISMFDKNCVGHF